MSLSKGSIASTPLVSFSHTIISIYIYGRCQFKGKHDIDLLFDETLLQVFGFRRNWMKYIITFILLGKETHM